MTDTEPHASTRAGPSRSTPRDGAPPDARSDRVLLDVARHGDARAFGEFYLRHATGLFAYFRPRCSNPQDAYDLVSETFAEAFQSLDRFDPELGEPGAWLFGIARNKHRHFARRGAVETRGRQRMEMSVAPLSPDELDQLEHTIDLTAARQQVTPAIEALPDTLRDAVHLRCVEGAEYDDIAAHLGIPQATVRKRVSRGLRQLSDSLGPNNPFRSHE